MTAIEQALREAEKKLKLRNIETSRLDAEVLLSFATKRQREWILAHPKSAIPKRQLEEFEKIISSRLKGKPVPYIIGKKEFFSLEFTVNDKVLIPRPETELLVEKAISYVRTYVRTSNSKQKLIIADIGTGSGNIIVSLAENILRQTTVSQKQSWKTEKIQLVAIDISKDALEVAKRNASNHHLDGDIVFLRGRFLNPLLKNIDSMLKTSVDIVSFSRNIQLLVLANLPYLSRKVYCAAPTAVANFEPMEALVSGQDGLDHYRKLINQIKIIKELYALPVAAFFEISPEQKQPLAKELQSAFSAAKVDFFRDLAGKNRIMSLKT